MRSLRDFLLAEAKDNKSEKIPEGFKKIETRGGLTGVAKEAMGGSYKEGIEAAATKEGKDQIKEKLKGSGSGSIKKILTSVVKTPNPLDDVFVGIYEKSDDLIGDNDGVIIKLSPSNWTSLAGTASSSQRLLKFWLQSTLVAYGLSSKHIVSIKAEDNLIAVCG